MKKVIALVLALMLMIPAFAMAEDIVKIPISSTEPKRFFAARINLTPMLACSK